MTTKLRPAMAIPGRAAVVMGLLAALAATATAQQPAPAQQPATAQPPATAPETGPPTGLAALRQAEAALKQLIARAEPSVVAISHSAPRRATQGGRFFEQGDAERLQWELLRAPLTDSPAAPTGAGVVIDPAGLVLTQYLVVKPGDQHLVTTIDGKRFPAKIRAADPRSGLAVLEADVDQGVLSALPIGHAEDLQKGSSVVTIGNPYAVLTDGQPTASFGSITNLARKAGPHVNLNNAPDPQQGLPATTYRTTLHHYGALIQSDARLGWNASGGALINLDGELVGITTTVSVIAGHEQPAGYAIPLSEPLRRIVQTLKEGREVEYGLLGISFNANTASTTADGRRGISVQRAYPGGPAGRAGLQPRDIITDIDGKPVDSADSLQLVVGQRPPGYVAEVGFERRGQQRRVRVELAKHYAIGERVVTTPAPRWRGIRVDYSTALSQRDLEQAAAQQLIDPLGCVVVAEVDENSVSWRQGVRPGLFISHVGGTRVTTPREFWSAVVGSEESVSLRFTQPADEP